MPVISIRDLVKTYHVGEVTVRALRGANLDVEAGEFVAVTGPSGSGKSTLMHILGCLDRPTSGSYILDGKDVSRMSKDELAIIRNRKIGFVFQGFNLLSRTTALDNVELPLLYNGAEKLKAAERHKRAMEALTAVGLGERFHHFPNQLSGGQQQRVAIARALVTRAVDPAGRRADREPRHAHQHRGHGHLPAAEHASAASPMLLITHEMDIAEYGTRLVRFRDGRIQIDQKITNRRDAGEGARGAAAARSRDPPTTLPYTAESPAPSGSSAASVVGEPACPYS